MRNRLVKKTISAVTTGIVLLTSCMNLWNAGYSTVLAYDDPNDVYFIKTVDSQNYGVAKGAGGSFISKTSDGYMLVYGEKQEDAGFLKYYDYESLNGQILVEYYDSSFNRTSHRYIKMDLPIFGYFYEYGGYYYIISGQDNYSESVATYCYCIAKYDTNWNKIANSRVRDCCTVTPFACGCTVEAVDGVLFIRAGHEMFAGDDGFHHEANIQILCDADTLEILNADDIKTRMHDYGYVSHSFAQYVVHDGDDVYYVDHGDAYPRAIVINEVDNYNGLGKVGYYNNGIKVLKIPGNIGDNATGVSIGGAAASSSHVLIAGSTKLTNSYGGDSIDSLNDSRSYNIFISSYNRLTGETDFRKLTDYVCNGNYSADDQTASTPYLIDIGNDRFLVMWSKIPYWDVDEFKEKKVYLQIIDGKGVPVGDIMTVTADLSDCDPVIAGNSLIWYTMEGVERHLYTLSLSTFTVDEKVWNDGRNAESISPYLTTFYVGGTYDISFKVCPENAVPPHVTWRVDPTDSGEVIATVDENGTLTALSSGETWLWHYITDDEYSHANPITIIGNIDTANFVERLYSVALGRSSDPYGKTDWIEAINARGVSGGDVARGFLYSSEFMNKSVSNEEFVRTLYRTFFDREADQAGLDAWVNVLNNGGTKEHVIEGFINSNEWATLCAGYGIASGGTGVADTHRKPSQGTIGFCTRLYTTCLEREADQAGLMAWAQVLADQEETGTGAAHGFFFSKEFLDLNTSNEEYVTRLYRTFMGREPDKYGFEAWVSQLDQGGSREEVFRGFAQSVEFTNICNDYGILRG